MVIVPVYMEDGNRRKTVAYLEHSAISVKNLRKIFYVATQLEGYYFIQNGLRLEDDSILGPQPIYAVPRMYGGKGGFGSMLRAIGAQIEKTTNREACRDLSGRRLRDINEELRLKNWITQQADREHEAEDRKKKRLERLAHEPKHNFKEEDYEKDRLQLTQNLFEAVEQGLRADSSRKQGIKRKHDRGPSLVQKRKSCLWVDNDLSSSLESDDSVDDMPSTSTYMYGPSTSSDADKPGTFRNSAHWRTHDLNGRRRTLSGGGGFAEKISCGRRASI